MTTDSASAALAASDDTARPEALERMLARLERVQGEIERLSSAGLRETQDRSWIARNVFYMFNAAVLTTELIYVAQAWRGGDWTQLTPQTTELLRSVVVPIVTLILGYYFGKSAKP